MENIFIGSIACNFYILIFDSLKKLLMPFNTKKFFLLLVFIFSSAFIHAAIISGVITDEKGEVLSYATVLIKGTTQGATANGDGKYTLTLAAGTYTLVFQYVGYSPKSKVIEVANEPIKLDVQLHTQQMELKEIVVNSDAEDPAYKVIRAAIKKRKYYLNQVDEFSCKVYIKGIQKFDSIPKRIMGFNANKLGLDSSMLGIVYLSESESEYNYQKPDKIREVMYSSKVSGDNKAFSYNQASDFDFNFYKNLLDIGSLSDRGFVSPISESALLYYRFKLVGTFYNNNELVNKILVTPRRKTDPVFSGYIYIVEDNWRIHSVDLFLTKDANIDFVDSLELKQIFSDVIDSVFMPINQTMLFQFKAFGIKGNGYFIGSFTDYNLSPSFPKKFFRGETLKVNDDANKKDSSYWTVNRPIPLTQEEMNDYRKKDSIAIKENSKEYLDSLDRKRNKFGFSDLFLGYNYYKRFNKTTTGTGSILELINFNTVQGWAPEFSLHKTKRLSDNRVLKLSADWEYGFSNKKFGGTVRLLYNYKPVKLQRFWVEGGSRVKQFNEGKPINGLMNTCYTLFYEENFMKLYNNTFGTIAWQNEIKNGIRFSTRATYNHRQSLPNYSNPNPKSFNDRANVSFTGNYPYGVNADSSFTTYNALITSIGLKINFKQQYYTRPNEKIIVGSKYPTLRLTYIKGWQTLKSKVNFDQVEAELTDNFKLGLLGNSSYLIRTGGFLNRKFIGEVEKKHFMGNQTVFALSDHLRGFQLLPYYTYSTDQYYLEGHYEHHFNGFFSNKIPLLRKLKLKEVGSAHYLITPEINYCELSVGLEHILKFFRIDWINSFSNQLKLDSGFVFGINIGDVIQIDL